jgi:RNA polymerase sigma factor (sigma-70 family)
MANGQVHSIIRHIRSLVLVQDAAGMTDSELLESFVSQRDEVAFETLVRRHGPMVFNICGRVLQDPDDAEDAFQATFLVFVRRAASIAKRQLLGNWLYGVAYRTARAAKSAASRRRAKEARVVPRQVSPPEDTWQELQRLLDQELTRLPDKYRIPVVLCHLEGKSRREAAQQLHLPEGTLSSRLARARILLAGRLARSGLIVSGGTLAAALSQQTASAALSPSLLSSTVKAGALVLAGQAATTGAVSAEVAALTERVLKAMLVTRLKIAAAVLLIVGVLGGGLFAQLPLSGTPAEAKPVDATKGAAPEPAPKPGKRPQEVLAQAVGLADDVMDEPRKAFALMNIATAQARTGDRDAATRTFARATAAAKAITHVDASKGEVQKAMTLMFIAQAQAEAGQIEDALATAGAIENSGGHHDKEWALAAIAAAQTKARDVKGALKTVETLSDRDKSLALKQVAEHLAAAGQVEQALKLVEGIQDESDRVEALTKIAAAQGRAGDRDGAKKVIALARRIADGIEDGNSDPNTSPKAWALMLVALSQIESGDEKGGLKLADDFKGARRRDMILADVAIRRARAGKVKEASQAVDDIRDGIQKAEVLKAIAASQARTGDFKEARKTIDAIGFISEKAEALSDLAAVRLEAGDRDAAADLYRESIQALKTLDTLWYDEGPTMCAIPIQLHRIVSTWAEAGDDKNALAWVDKQDSAFVRAVALAGIAEGIVKRLDREGRPAEKK